MKGRIFLGTFVAIAVASCLSVGCHRMKKAETTAVPAPAAPAPAAPMAPAPAPAAPTGQPGQ